MEKTEKQDSKKQENESNERWGPQNVGYDSYKKIINSLHVLRADTKKVNISSLSSAAGFLPKSILSAMLFLNSLGVVEGNKDGYRVTESGQVYVKAIVQNDTNSLKQESQKIIDKTFLQKLKNYITVNKEDLSLEKIYRFAASEARYGEGKGPFNLHQPHFTGIRTLLQIFKNAEYLPPDFSLDAQHGPKPSTKKSEWSKKKKSGGGKTNTNPTFNSDNSRYMIQTDHFVLTYDKEMDDDTFEHMKSQIESELQFRTKKRNETTEL